MKSLLDRSDGARKRGLSPLRSPVRRSGMRIAIVGLSLGLSLALSGCAIGSKSMSLDSTSKMPWFGLELKGRKPKSDGPQFRSVMSEQSDKSRVATVGRSGAAIESATGDSAKNPPKKSSTALPTTDQSLVLDSTRKDPSEVDFR